MAKKNPLEKYAKYLLKGNLYIQFSEDSVYLSEGCTIVKMPKWYYNERVWPISDVFVEFKPNTAWKKLTTDDMPTEWANDQLKKYLAETPTDALVRFSNFIVENGTGRVRLCKVNGDLVGINDKFLVMLQDFADEWYGCNAITGIKWNSVDGSFAAMIMPVLLAENQFDFFKEIFEKGLTKAEA